VLSTENEHTWQCFGVVDADAGPGFGHPVGVDGQPGGAAGGLLLELAIKGGLDVVHGEDADGRAHQSVHGRGEGRVELAARPRHLVDALCNQITLETSSKFKEKKTHGSR
jgi:hypothetical protein